MTVNDEFTPVETFETVDSTGTGSPSMAARCMMKRLATYGSSSRPMGVLPW